MTGTQHVGTLKHQFLHFITVKTVLVIFHYQNNIFGFFTFYLEATSTGSKLQLFSAGVSGNIDYTDLKAMMLIQVICVMDAYTVHTDMEAMMRMEAHMVHTGLEVMMPLRYGL
jgi:hypothetical protein